jgi:glycosyltransferase involved in cell wall biosynthesis
MKCGVPVLAGNSSSLPEVLGDGADLIAPDDIAAWAAALERVITDSQWRDELVARGYKRAACYSWEATAKATLAVYDRILS